MGREEGVVVGGADADVVVQLWCGGVVWCGVV